MIVTLELGCDKAGENVKSSSPHIPCPAADWVIRRLPRGEALEITRAAEVFERTIEIVLEHVQQGHQFNFSRYSECCSCFEKSLL